MVKTRYTMALSLEEITSKYKSARRQSLLAILQEIQDEYGYLNEECIMVVSRHLNLPASKIYGIATFYDQFRFSPRGKCHIKVCNGTCCHMHGSASLKKEAESLLNIKPGQTTRDGYFSLEELNCMGACSQSPVLSVDTEFYTSVSPSDIKGIIEKHRSK